MSLLRLNVHLWVRVWGVSVLVNVQERLSLCMNLGAFCTFQESVCACLHPEGAMKCVCV